MKHEDRRKLPLAATLVLVTIAGSCVSPPPPIVPPVSPRPPKAEAVGPSELVDEVVEAHNARRGKAGLSPLSRNPLLEASAKQHARDMAGRRKMFHQGGDGSSPFDRMQRNGYQFVAAAENVAYGFDEVEAVMVGWMKSPGHRRNILGNFSEIGVGRAIASDGASYWCVTFGTPAGH
jgi:uncharacterized protein YkwD